MSNIRQRVFKVVIMRKFFAWAVHIFTASGLIAGFCSILAINEGDWRMAMFFLVIALVIDGIDGTFARIVKVKEVLPKVDGKMIDYVVDFVNYAFIPAYFFHAAGLVSDSFALPLSFLILLVSAIYYGREGMVSNDNYFIGFPVLWNIAIFYLVFIFQTTALVNAMIVIILAILHFVPIKCAYPSQASRLKWPSIIVSIWFAGIITYATYVYPEVSILVRIQAMLILLYFGILCIFDTFEIGKSS